ncbi:hypothetical protein [Dyadobacter bucti]|uniref:hypothetical protein n=1 Tax=Dyadobacter bucti TaxID=2572203 RepID=UPI003F6EF20C
MQVTKGSLSDHLTVALFYAMLREYSRLNAYFLNAGAIGWYVVLTIVVIYNVLTLSGMMLMVNLGSKGIKSINIHWLEHYEQLITGLTLIGLAILKFIVEI